MTDLVQKRGTSRNRKLLFRESDEVTPVDITGGVVKVAIKFNADDDNDDAIAIFRSYFSDEIDLSDPVNGEALWQTQVHHTQEAEACEYVWGAELTLLGALRTSAGTLTATTGSVDLVYSGPDIAKFKAGDLIVPNGALAAGNQKTVTVMSVDEETGVVTTDYTGWQSEAFAHDTYIGNRPDVSNRLNGTFTLTADAVS